MQASDDVDETRDPRDDILATGEGREPMVDEDGGEVRSSASIHIH